MGVFVERGGGEEITHVASQILKPPEVWSDYSVRKKINILVRQDDTH
jgi:hypothetical protein